MKKLLLILFITNLSFSQSNLFIKSERDSTLIKVCNKRGHVEGSFRVTTAMNCPSYIVDTDSTTVVVQPACNSYSYNCRRCGYYITEQEKETRTVIWKKED